jgi:hypothetical protein
MANPKEVHVKVFVTPGDPNGDFHFETTDLPMGPNNHLYFTNCGNDGFYVHYDLQGGAYRFPDSTINNWKKEALYSHAQSACPTAQGQWGQFETKDVLNGGQTLVVWNKNNSKQDFAYTLRVTNDNGASYLPLDPGGTNNNGSVRADLSLAAAVVGGAIAGSLVTLGVQSLMGS